MLKRFLEYIKQHKLIAKNEKILLGVSGGIDSVCMLEMFKKLDIDLAIAHCNFSLRGDESDRDEDFVRSLAGKTPIFATRFDTKKYAKENNVSIQMAARDLRYNWFEELLRDNEYSKIAIAHNKNDVIETFFINLVRGTGIKGLSGIQPITGNIIRPLLFADRKEIDDFITKNKIKYREDSSNAEVKYARNKIRHEVIPVLENINPSFADSMIDNISRLNDTEAIYRKQINSIKNKLVYKEGDVTKIDINELSKHSFEKTLLFEILSEYGFHSKIISDIAGSLSAESGKQFFSASHRLIKDRDTLIITELKENDSREYYINENDFEIDVPIKLEIKTFLKNKDFNIPKSSSIACLDKNKLLFPLTIRKWQQGDKFKPLGMSGFKKLSDFFTDNKFSLDQKENAWLLCSNNDIVWVIGHRIDDRFKTNDDTKLVLHISS